MAAVATHEHLFQAEELGPVDRATWDALRRQMGIRHTARHAQRRFRRDPHAYLAALEDQLLKPVSPS